MKNATAVALTEVNAADQAALDTIVNICNTGFNDAPNPKWGDRKLGLKTQRSIAKRELCLPQKQPNVLLLKCVFKDNVVILVSH